MFTLLEVLLLLLFVFAAAVVDFLELFFSDNHFFLSSLLACLPAFRLVSGEFSNL